MTKNKRRYYAGPPDKQPKDCGRPHPQPICMCVMCEVAARFDEIERLQLILARVKRIRDM